MKEIIKDYISRIDLMKTFVGVSLISTFCYMCWVLTQKELPANNREAIIHIIGVIEGVVVSICAFYYGSSRSSQRKDETIKIHAENGIPRVDK